MYVLYAKNLFNSTQRVMYDRLPECLDQISFGRTTHLHFQPYRKNMDIKSHFANMNGSVDVCIMNAGSHFKEDGDMYYAFDIVLPWIQELKV